MTQNATLYTAETDLLSVDEIRRIVDNSDALVDVTDLGVGKIQIRWPDVTVTLHPMESDKVEEHVQGLAGFIVAMAGGDPEPLKPLFGALLATKSVIGCVIEPGYDGGPDQSGLLAKTLAKFKKGQSRPHKVKSLLVSMAATYHACFIFANESLYSPMGDMVFGDANDGSFADLEDLTVRVLRNEPPDTTKRQEERTERVKQQLKQWSVPEYGGHIRWMLDDDDYQIQSPKEVARRVLALHAVVCFARGRDHAECLEELTAAGAEDALSANEREFFYGDPDEDERQKMIWNLEGLGQMMWALGHITESPYPNEMCNVDELHDLIFEKSRPPAAFINDATLVDRTTLLDRLEFLTRVHWALRDAMVNGNPMPLNIDWSDPDEMVPMSPNMGVVAERHKTLNWISGFNGPDWDEADTPT